jgi:hypothetical protein
MNPWKLSRRTFLATSLGAQLSARLRGGRALKNVGRFRPAACQLVKEFQLVAHLGLDPIADESEAFGLIGDFELSAADGRRAAHLGLPDARKGLAEFVQDEVDVVLAGQLDGVAAYQNAGGDQDALDLVSGDGQLLRPGLDREAVAGPSQARPNFQIPHPEWMAVDRVQLALRKSNRRISLVKIAQHLFV